MKRFTAEITATGLMSISAKVAVLMLAYILLRLYPLAR